MDEGKLEGMEKWSGIEKKIARHFNIFPKVYFSFFDKRFHFCISAFKKKLRYWKTCFFFLNWETYSYFLTPFNSQTSLCHLPSFFFFSTFSITQNPKFKNLSLYPFYPFFYMQIIFSCLSAIQLSLCHLASPIRIPSFPSSIQLPHPLYLFSFRINAASLSRFTFRIAWLILIMLINWKIVDEKNLWFEVFDGNSWWKEVFDGSSWGESLIWGF